MPIRSALFAMVALPGQSVAPNDAGGIVSGQTQSVSRRLAIVVADLTTANANVFYELGLRHAVRAWSTVLVFAEGGSRLPFDVAPLRALPYRLNAAGVPDDLAVSTAALAN